ncbi:hypothetical protein [Solibacillus isronensis]|uniref:hypothetical protein n=1 Tax=Solibacillus isronensis TaxID=412383 RepID=UPI00203D26E0|nr:hypothetical protein [Solibacillus isronensis]MCM3722953.1 hypothetical protein [Solibacillus isronensis]
MVRTKDFTYNKTFWMDEQKFEQSNEWDWTRIRLVDEVDNPELSLAHLREQGLKGDIQGLMKLTGVLRVYIMPFFDRDLTDGFILMKFLKH